MIDEMRDLRMLDLIRGLPSPCVKDWHFGALIHPQLLTLVHDLANEVRSECYDPEFYRSLRMVPPCGYRTWTNSVMRGYLDHLREYGHQGGDLTMRNDG